MPIHRLALTTFVALAGAAMLSSNAGAQNYPNKPLRLIVPFPPGGGNDILARAVGQRLAETIGQQIIVDNLHLFFGPLESNQLILHLTIDQQATEAPPLNLAIRPLWFNRILFEEQQPFKMGIEFFEKIGEDDFRRLKKLAGR